VNRLLHNIGCQPPENDLVPTESRSSLGVSGTETSTYSNRFRFNRACEMHQTQTFVHRTILLLPRARLTPLRTPAFEINSRHPALEDSNRYSANCRLAARSEGSSKRPA